MFFFFSYRREEEARIVAQLLTLMSGSKASSKYDPRVAVVASTNRLIITSMIKSVVAMGIIVFYWKRWLTIVYNN